jgi:hypothetical protein
MNNDNNNYTWIAVEETDCDVSLALSIETLPEYSPAAILIYNKDTHEVVINNLLFNTVKYDTVVNTLEEAKEKAIDYLCLQISKKMNSLKKIKAALTNKLY